jgi:uncharacterized glyoxalase superfamily protein PhnB
MAKSPWNQPLVSGGESGDYLSIGSELRSSSFNFVADTLSAATHRSALRMSSGKSRSIRRPFQDNAKSHSPVGIHIFTHELEQLHEEVVQRGARLSQEIMQKRWGNRDFRVTDEWRNEIKFTEPLLETA